MDLVTALADCFDHTGAVLAGVTADQWHDSTPCAEWDVRALATHTMGVVENMGRTARGEEPVDDVNGVDLGTDPAARFRTVAASTLAAWEVADLDAPLDFGGGRMVPTRFAVMVNLLDTSTHAWDLARATGQVETLPAGVAEAALASAHEVVRDEIRGTRGFDPAIVLPSSASSTDQLVAFLGREPSATTSA
jgi:uncharacterized protein (TIGR03086 family)